MLKLCPASDLKILTFIKHDAEIETESKQVHARNQQAGQEGDLGGFPKLARQCRFQNVPLHCQLSQQKRRCTRPLGSLKSWLIARAQNTALQQASRQNFNCRIQSKKLTHPHGL